MYKFFVFANTLFISLEKILGIRVAGNIYGFLGGSDGKESNCLWETWVQLLDWEDSLEEGMATHSSILAWRIPMDKGA